MSECYGKYNKVVQYYFSLSASALVQFPIIGFAFEKAWNDQENKLIAKAANENTFLRRTKKNHVSIPVRTPFQPWHNFLYPGRRGV